MSYNISCVHIANVPVEFDLLSLRSEYGPLTRFFKANGKPFGFVEFETREQAQDCIDNFSGYKIDDAHTGLALSFARGKPKSDRERMAERGGSYRPSYHRGGGGPYRSRSPRRYEGRPRSRSPYRGGRDFSPSRGYGGYPARRSPPPPHHSQEYGRPPRDDYHRERHARDLPREEPYDQPSYRDYPPRSYDRPPREGFHHRDRPPRDFDRVPNPHPYPAGDPPHIHHDRRERVPYSGRSRERYHPRDEIDRPGRHRHSSPNGRVDGYDRRAPRDYPPPRRDHNGYRKRSSPPYPHPTERENAEAGSPQGSYGRQPHSPSHASHHNPLDGPRGSERRQNGDGSADPRERSESHVATPSTSKDTGSGWGDEAAPLTTDSKNSADGWGSDGIDINPPN
ncbi:hypothetical protein H4219_002898 [Mycoemilia scoparia]|uniref:RRM domain-containing protein n=1 Tax=Mycoemilia scoparia TaxID=417184 RepID=A0A9W8A044_9FUNG|nr:hypothetical protein H4219_002898 [Mycoemilia scoparia]